MKKISLVYIVNDRRFLTPLRCIRNDTLPYRRMVEGIGGESADSLYPSSFTKRLSFRMKRSGIRNLLKCVLRVFVFTKNRFTNNMNYLMIYT